MTYLSGNNEYYKDVEKAICHCSTQENDIKINSNVSELDSNKLKNHINRSEYYVMGLTKKRIFRHATYGTVSRKKIYLRGIDVFDNGKIKLTEYDTLKCRFKWQVNQYKCQIKFSRKCFDESIGLTSTRDILDCRCSCDYQFVCKHLVACMITIMDDSYEVQSIIPYNAIDVCFSYWQ